MLVFTESKKTGKSPTENIVKGGADYQVELIVFPYYVSSQTGQFFHTGKFIEFIL